METNAKLFRAIVILGAALTTPACEGGKCPTNQCTPSPPDGSVVIVDGGRPLDDGATPRDAEPSDVILIL